MTKDKIRYAIARPIEGISLNGVEYLCDDDGNRLEFYSRNECIEHIKSVGLLDPEEYIWELTD